MGSDARDRSRLTAKGERTQARIIEAAAGLIYERGVAGTSLDEIRSAVIAEVKTSQGQGGCPLGSLAGQVAETDADARDLLAAGFGQWSAAIGDGLRRLHAAGDLPDGTDPDKLAVILLAALQGGLILAQVQRDTRPLETAVDTILDLACLSRREVKRPTAARRAGIRFGHAKRLE